MKKNIFLFLLLFVLPACTLPNSQTKNFEFHKGNITIDELFNKYPVFSIQPELEIINSEFSIEDDIKVLIFFGTWCHDSKRELPRLFKILQSYGLSDNNLELIAVGPDKRDPLNRAEDYNLLYTPTIVFLKDSKEVGRIVEKPKKSLEIDIVEILSLK